MDLTTLVRDNVSLYPFLLLSALFFLLLIIMHTKLDSSKNIKNLPPGPRQLPIIGNLHQVGDKPHVSIANFAKTYGPLMSLCLGKQLVVVASSPEAAIGILRTQDRLLSSRVVPITMKQPHLLPHSLMWSECNETWKSLRTLIRTELFSAKALESQLRLREEKIGQLLDFLRRTQGEVIDIEDVVFTTLFNTLSSIIFGKDLLDLKDGHGAHDGLKESLHKVIENGTRINLGAFYPMLDKFDLHGIRKGTMKLFDKIFSYWEGIVEERRAIVNSSSWSSEQAQSFLDRLLENGFSNNQIDQLVTELFAAGTNTTTSTVTWAMSEIMRHKEVMTTIKEEIEKEITNSDPIMNLQVSKLTYLQACIKESFRMHPPVPLLLPHMAVETCEVMNYTIPKNATIYVNVWAMGRDPKIWNDPLSFKPERFINSKFDFKGQDFELLPFGSGRRMCPGLPSGVRSVETLLASLIGEFDWGLPNGDDTSNLDMNDKFGIALKREKALKIIFTQKQA